MRLVSPGALPFSITSVGLTAVASAISPEPTAMRSTGSAQSTSTDLPAPTTKSFAVSCPVVIGVGAAVPAGAGAGGAGACPLDVLVEKAPAEITQDSRNNRPILTFT